MRTSSMDDALHLRDYKANFSCAYCHSEFLTAVTPQWETCFEFLVVLACLELGLQAQQGCSAMATGAGATLNGFIPFPADNLWNQNIAGAPIVFEFSNIIIYFHD